MNKINQKLIMLLVFSLIISTVLSACNNKKEVKEKPSKEITEKNLEETEVAEGGEKVLRLASTEINTLNNHVSTGSGDKTAQNYITGKLLEIIYDKELKKSKFVGYHAEDLPKTEDNITWTIKLRDDLKWDDEEKTPITAETYVYSWKKLLDPKLVNNNSVLLTDDIQIKNAKGYLEGKITNWEEVGIKILDDNKIQITLEDKIPTIDFLNIFSDVKTGPVYEKKYEAGMNEDGTETDYGTSLDKFVSSGTYKMDEWIRDQSRIYTKREGTPFSEIYIPDKIEERALTESTTRLQLFEKGELDFVSLVTEYDRFKEDPRVVFDKGNSIWGYYINTESSTNPILNNKDFRQALFYGLDRDEIAEGVYKTYESTPWFVASSAIVDLEKGEKYSYTEEAKSIRPENGGYDPEKAKKLFDKAYIDNGSKKINLELIYFEGQEDMKRMVEVTKEQYENLFGEERLNVELRAMEFMTAYEAYKEKKYDLGVGGTGQNFYNPWASLKSWTSEFPSKNDTFNNEEFDKLFERTTVGDLKLETKERLKALMEMEKILIENVPQVPVFQSDNAWIYSDRINLITDGEYVPGVGFAILQSDIRE